MTTELERQLIELKQGDHICPIYETRAEQMAAAVPYMKEGLARGERCLYIGDDSDVEAVAQALAAAEVDIAHERERGALWILTKRESYLKSGKFDPQMMIDFMRSAQAQALADSFSGLRVTGEMTWALGPGIAHNDLIEYEALLNRFSINSRSIVLCQYNREHFGPAVIHDVLLTHPIAILGDQVCPNPFYYPPDLALPWQAEPTVELMAKRVDWRIHQLKEARKAAQERERVLERLKQSERGLRESEQLMQLVLNTLPVGVVVTDRAADVILANPASKRVWGEVIVSGRERWARSKGFWHDSGKRIDAESWASARALAEGQTSLNELIDIETFDGKQKTIQNSAAPIRTVEGSIIGVVVVNEDVTERVQAQKALRESADRLQQLSHRLLEVQEKERRHLARELHDEVGQLLTGLRLILKSKDDLTAEEAKTQFEKARTLADELLEIVRQLSFDLRPAALDQLGLLPSLLALFERFGKQAGVLVNFKHQGMDRRFAPEVETTAYRIVQEALTNVARHAGVEGVSVKVWAAADTLSIEVEDLGRGFDPEEVLATPRHGGIPGMQERIALLGGRLTIESRPGEGTRITAELPISAAGETHDSFHSPGG
jgi:PAS domain S-box-containing protein